MEFRLAETKSYVGLSMNCSVSGNATGIDSGYTNNFGAPYIKTPSYMTGDICNVSIPYLKHSDLEKVTAFYRGVYDNGVNDLFVNGKLCRLGASSGSEITSCFKETGIHDLTFQTDLVNSNDGFGFNLRENYYCPPECADCVNEKCCPSNYVIENQDCGCEESSLSSCSCPFGYVLHRHDNSQSSLYACHKIDIFEDQRNFNENLKENTVISKSGLDISCSITGLSSTAISTVHSSKNNIAGTDWVWTYNGPVDNDNCNVNIVFFKHSLSNITLQFDGEDVQNFFVNSALCWSGGRGTLTSVSVSECFGLTGFMSLLFSLSTPLVHLACHLSW